MFSLLLLVFSPVFVRSVPKCCPVEVCDCLFNDTFIDCAYRRLSSIPRVVKQDCGNYRSMSFKGNDIQCPLDKDFTYLPRLKYVDFSDNPAIICSCLDRLKISVNRPNHCSVATSPSPNTMLILTTRPFPTVSRAVSRTENTLSWSQSTSLKKTTRVQLITPTRVIITTVASKESPICGSSAISPTTIDQLTTRKFSNTYHGVSSKDVEWVFQTSIAVPVCILLIVTGVLLRKCIKKHCLHSSPRVQAFELNHVGFYDHNMASAMADEDEIVVFAINRKEETKV